jgi:hypothetical protein
MNIAAPRLEARSTESVELGRVIAAPSSCPVAARAKAALAE